MAKLGIENFDQMMDRKSVRSEKLSQGEPVRAERRITFASAEDLLACLTRERIRLFNKVRDESMSISVSALALQRPRTVVERDVKVLKAASLLRLRKENNPGHGAVQRVTARAKRVKLRADL